MVAAERVCHNCSHGSVESMFRLPPPMAAHVLLSFTQVRVALRASADLPRLVWGGDHIDEGHRKLFAAELLGSHSFIPDDDGIHNGFLFTDAAVPKRRRVPGFAKRGLVKILQRMKLTEKPTFVPHVGSVDNGLESGVEDDVVVSDYSDDTSASYSSALSFDAADGRRHGKGRTDSQPAAGAGDRSGAGGEVGACDDEEDGDAFNGECEREDSLYWGVGDDGQGARWDDEDA